MSIFIPWNAFFYPRRKMANLIYNEILVIAETIFISGKDCSFQAFCDSGKEHSEILAMRGNKKNVKQLRRCFDFVC